MKSVNFVPESSSMRLGYERIIPYNRVGVRAQVYFQQKHNPRSRPQKNYSQYLRFLKLNQTLY